MPFISSLGQLTDLIYSLVFAMYFCIIAASLQFINKLL